MSLSLKLFTTSIRIRWSGIHPRPEFMRLCGLAFWYGLKFMLIRTFCRVEPTSKDRSKEAWEKRGIGMFYSIAEHRPAVHLLWVEKWDKSIFFQFFEPWIVPVHGWWWRYLQPTTTTIHFKRHRLWANLSGTLPMLLLDLSGSRSRFLRFDHYSFLQCTVVRNGNFGKQKTYLLHFGSVSSVKLIITAQQFENFFL